jgi:alpha-galactosidase
MSITVAGFTINIEEKCDAFEMKLTPRKGEVAGIEYLDIKFSSSEPVRPTPVTLNWVTPKTNAHQRTSATERTKIGGCGRNRVPSNVTSNAPIFSAFDFAGVNAFTFAIDDAINSCELSTQLAEEDSCLTCRVKLFCAPLPPIKDYEVTLRIDTRKLPYEKAMSDISDWWAAMPIYSPAEVPEHARLPMYSTWYNFHLEINPEVIEKECKLAKELGMESVIVDDGWQTDNNNRGYSYCGDWEAAPSKFSDMRAHVDKVHALGMKYLLWFSVPFVGIHSKAYGQFKDKFLNPDPTGKAEWFVLDPRFPEVREYLIAIYERSLNDFDLDGFKLDFVDCFGANPKTKDIFGNGRDFESVAKAADQLMTDIMKRLKAIKPDIMIEFRQSYIGPAMRKYGNIFRVGDEPNYCAGNRIGSMLLRTLSGNTAVHSDMVMWHSEDSVESAAMQLIHVVFTVPQISVILDEIPKDHVDMIKHYLTFWKENRDVLIDGTIHPLQPQHAYPVIISESENKVAAAAYANGFIPLPVLDNRQLILINGTLEERVVVELPDDAGQKNIKVWSCTGEVVEEGTILMNNGLHRINIPAAGTAIIS